MSIGNPKHPDVRAFWKAVGEVQREYGVTRQRAISLVAERKPRLHVAFLMATNPNASAETLESFRRTLARLPRA